MLPSPCLLNSEYFRCKRICLYLLSGTSVFKYSERPMSLQPPPPNTHTHKNRPFSSGNCHRALSLWRELATHRALTTGSQMFQTEYGVSIIKSNVELLHEFMHRYSSVPRQKPRDTQPFILLQLFRVLHSLHVGDKALFNHLYYSNTDSLGKYYFSYCA